MSKFTPGPWHSAMVSEKTWNVGVYDGSGTQVALLKVASALSAPMRDADARLIAAAPELLDMLQMIVKSTFYVPRESAFRPLLEAVIAKATGEQA